MYRGSLGDYGSHYPILAAAVARTAGPVLELGAGDWSTPMLHYMCKAMGRHLDTCDSDPKWLDRFGEYRSEHHQLINMHSNWVALVNVVRFGVAFVDSAPGEGRVQWIERLKDRTHFIVAHDSERDHGTGANYMYERVTPLFKYVSEFRRFRPYTLVLSNVEPFEIDECDRVWEPPQ